MLFFSCDKTDAHYIQVILNLTSWTNLYIVRPFDCPSGQVKNLITELLNYPNASVVPMSKNTTGFDDFILLSSANKLIEDKSTYSYWAGIFSNALEKHVKFDFHAALHLNVISPRMSNQSRGYIYHDSNSHNYFGRLLPNGTMVFEYHIPVNSFAPILNPHLHHHNISHPHHHNRTHAHVSVHRNNSHIPISHNISHPHHHNRTHAPIHRNNSHIPISHNISHPHYHNRSHINNQLRIHQKNITKI